MRPVPLTIPYRHARIPRQRPPPRQSRKPRLRQRGQSGRRHRPRRTTRCDESGRTPARRPLGLPDQRRRTRPTDAGLRSALDGRETPRGAARQPAEAAVDRLRDHGRHGRARSPHRTPAHEHPQIRHDLEYFGTGRTDRRPDRKKVNKRATRLGGPFHVLSLRLT